MGETSSSVGIAVLYPDLLGTYGDSGNAVVLERRLRWRGHATETVVVTAGRKVPESCDVYVLGGGEDGPQVEAARLLDADGGLHRAVERDAVVLAVCAGMQILGRSFPDPAGKPRTGLGILDCETVRLDRPRAVGEIVVDPVAPGMPTITGFENHGGRTRLGPEAQPLGTVEVGEGNGWGDEGVTTKHVVGTYLHGPVLARNPALADLLLGWVLGETPAPLPDVDQEVAILRDERLRAARAGELQPRRSWRDVIRRG